MDCTEVAGRLSVVLGTGTCTVNDEALTAVTQFRRGCMSHDAAPHESRLGQPDPTRPYSELASMGMPALQALDPHQRRNLR